MTPLVKEMSKNHHDYAVGGHGVWFDLCVVDEHEVKHDESLVYLPFDRTAMCFLDINGRKTALLTMTDENAGKRWVTVFGYFKRADGRFQDIVPLKYSFAEDGLDCEPVAEGHDISQTHCLAVLAAVAALMDRLKTTGTEGYQAIPKKNSFINQKRRVKGKPPSEYEWHTVVVPKRSEPSLPKRGTHATPKLHDVRRHFKPSIGKWVGPYMKGDPDKGVIEKDYRVTR